MLLATRLVFVLLFAAQGRPLANSHGAGGAAHLTLRRRRDQLQRA